MDKKIIRQQIIHKRKNLSLADAKQASACINKKILSLTNFIQAQNIGLYFSIHNEINLEYVYQQALKNSKLCFFPKVASKDSMKFYKFANGDKLNRNQWEIPEPQAKSASYIDVNDLDIIFLPLVAFDTHGNRIGMGAGYYDKALQNCKGTTLIGVAYEFQKVAEINAETWDIKLDIIITESEIYYF